MTSPGARSIRSFQPVTDEDLRTLAGLGALHHEAFRRAHPDWATILLTICLAQGAARHRVYGKRGVKDFDVWLFYALPPGRKGNHFPWNRNTVYKDFGPSAHGRPEHTTEEWANPKYPVATWEQYSGRRVDLLARAVPGDGGPVAAVQAWLRNDARCRPNAKGEAPSAWWLAQAPVIDLTAERFGELLWDPGLTPRTTE